MSRRLVEKELETSSKTYSRKEGCWNYIPAGMAEEEEITPQKIIGDIGYRSKKEEAAFLLGEEGTEVAVNPFKAKLGYGQKVLGYIPCEEEDGGVIYESGWLEPGTAVTKWEIAEELEPGDYPISLLVDTGSLDDYQQEMNKGTINATLHVE